VGETTAGTNGNINQIALPGGYRIVFTGMKVLKHDGTRHHGVGIAPTVPVARTIAAVAAGRDEQLERAVAIAGGSGPRLATGRQAYRTAFKDSKCMKPELTRRGPSARPAEDAGDRHGERDLAFPRRARVEPPREGGHRGIAQLFRRERLPGGAEAEADEVVGE